MFKRWREWWALLTAEPNSKELVLYVGDGKVRDYAPVPVHLLFIALAVLWFLFVEPYHLLWVISWLLYLMVFFALYDRAEYAVKALWRRVWQ